MQNFKKVLAEKIKRRLNVCKTVLNSNRNSTDEIRELLEIKKFLTRMLIISEQQGLISLLEQLDVLLILKPMSRLLCEEVWSLKLYAKTLLNLKDDCYTFEGDIAKYREEMLSLQDMENPDYAHLIADRIMCDIVTMYGHPDIVELFEEVDKNYG